MTQQPNELDVALDVELLELRNGDVGMPDGYIDALVHVVERNYVVEVASAKNSD